MKTDKEKLIDLLSTAGWNLFQNPIGDKELIADHLLKNGVTFEKSSNRPDIAYWDVQEDGTHFCSACGTDALWTEDGREFCSLYCPHCGLFMRKIVKQENICEE